MVNRTQCGWELTKQSLKILCRNKRILLLPLLSGMGCLLVLWLIGKPLWHIESSFLRSQQEIPLATILGILTLLIMLFIFNVINMYCNAALIACVANYFRTKQLSLIYGFRAGWFCLAHILGWTLFNTTIGFVLRKFPSRFEQSRNFASLLTSTPWSIVSYFVIPILVLENISVTNAIKKSSDVLHETWGESLISNTQLGLILFCALLVCFVPFIITIFTGESSYIFTGLIIGIGLFIILAIISAASNNILRTALYLYATDRDTALPFNNQLISTAFYSRK